MGTRVTIASYSDAGPTTTRQPGNRAGDLPFHTFDAYARIRTYPRHHPADPFLLSPPPTQRALPTVEWQLRVVARAMCSTMARCSLGEGTGSQTFRATFWLMFCTDLLAPVAVRSKSRNRTFPKA